METNGNAHAAAVMETNGNARAGALAAALAAVEIQKLLDGDLASVAAGHEVLLDAQRHVIWKSRLPRNAACRFSHERWTPAPTPDLPLRHALALAGPGADGARLGVPDESFVSRLACARCDLADAVWRLRPALDPFSLHCRRCGAPRPLRGFDLVERIGAGDVPVEHLEQPLSARGLRPGEVFSVGRPGEAPRHFVLDAAGARARADAPDAAGTHARADAPDAAAPPAGPPTTVVLAGCGNIGSFLAPLLARLRGLARVVLCDPDAYEAHQLAGQDMRAADAGRNKALVQATRLRALRPELRVEALAAPVEALPLGALRGAIAVSCLDSRAARVRLASRAWRMGSPFVDAAVGGGESLLVRSDVYLPGADAPCFECAFTASEYAALEQTWPCADAAAPAADAGHAAPAAAGGS